MNGIPLQMIPAATLLVDTRSGLVLDSNGLAQEILAASASRLMGLPVERIIVDWNLHLPSASVVHGSTRQFASRTLRLEGRPFQGTWRIGATGTHNGTLLAMLVHHPPLAMARRSHPPADRTADVAPRDRRHGQGVDYLTGLADRWVLESLIEQALDDRKRGASSDFGLVLIDLDGFKKVNDRWGHVQGDRVLSVVAQRLVAHVRPTDIVTRFGGDEFIIYADPVRSRADMHRIAERILAAIREPIPLSQTRLQISASVGFAFGSEASNLLDMINVADRVMYAAKADGGNRYIDTSSSATSA
jgi:diguanylate cyclase (GGDEF)-like protein